METTIESQKPRALSTQTANNVGTLNPQSSCPTCSINSSSAVSPSWIYSIGKIEPRFPSLAIEKEYAQFLGRSETAGLTDKQVLHETVSRPEGRYLARKFCWVMTIEGLETYLVYPRDPSDLSLLIGTIRANPDGSDLDIVIGSKGPLAPAQLCNGLQVPLVAIDQLYSVDRPTLIAAIPKPEQLPEEQFRPMAQELFQRIMLMTDNAGSTDEHRALNYLAVRYPAVYTVVSDAYARESSLDSISVQPSSISPTRSIVDVVFSFRSRRTDVVEKYFCRVDVTEQFPFLVTKMSPYFDR